MEILKQGTAPKDTDWKGSCRSCKTEVKAKQYELKNINQGYYRSEGPFSWEVCPVCDAGKNENGYGGLLLYPIA